MSQTEPNIQVVFHPDDPADSRWHAQVEGDCWWHLGPTEDAAREALSRRLERDLLELTASEAGKFQLTLDQALKLVPKFSHLRDAVICDLDAGKVGWEVTPALEDLNKELREVHRGQILNQLLAAKEAHEREVPGD